MRASHIALLSLAASTAAPVFAAPIRYVIIFHICDDPADPPILNSYLNARSEDGGAGLSARDSHGGCTESTSENHTSQPHINNPEEFIARDSVDGLITAITDMNARRSDVVKRNVPRGVTPESLAARLSPEDFLHAMLSDRSGQDIEARGLLSDLFETGMTILNDFRRDVTPGELAGRGVVDELLSTLSNHATREPSPSAPNHVARDDSSSMDAFMDALLNSRDSLMGELAGRDAADDLLNSYTSNHNTREPIPEQETQANSVRQDSSSTNTFIEALLNTRELGNEITPDHVLRLASLASRALDELD